MWKRFEKIRSYFVFSKSAWIRGRCEGSEGRGRGRGESVCMKERERERWIEMGNERRGKEREKKIVMKREVRSKKGEKRIKRYRYITFKGMKDDKLIGKGEKERRSNVEE